MAVLVQPVPLELAPLLTQPAPLSYQTMSRPRITVDTRRALALSPKLSMDSVQGNSRAGFEDTPISLSASSSTRTLGSAYCEYCLENDVAHHHHHHHSPWNHGNESLHDTDVDLEANRPFHRREPRSHPTWRRCLGSERLLPVIEFLIVLQMRLLTIMVPLLLLAAMYVFLRQAP